MSSYTGKPEEVLNVLLYYSTPYSIEAGLFMLTEPGVRLLCKILMCLPSHSARVIGIHVTIFRFLPEFWLLNSDLCVCTVRVFTCEPSPSPLLRQYLAMQNRMALNLE